MKSCFLQAAGMCAVVALAGCHDSRTAAPSSTATPADASAPAPHIAFEQASADLGDIPPESKSVATYTFMNDGKGPLKILDVLVTCGCTSLELVKRDYAPGERGTIKVSYQAPTSGGPVLLPLFVLSDDPANPRQELMLRANVVLHVIVEPPTFQLSLDAPNANAPTITLFSEDKKAFSITNVESSNGAISVSIDPESASTRFVVQPKVDIELLKTSLDGSMRFTITHPDVASVSVTYTTPAEFAAQPASIVLLKTTPLVREEQDVWVRSTTGREFEIESVTSQNGYLQVLSQERLDGSYRMKLAITPPRHDEELTFFDVLTIRIRNSSPLKVTCTGFYKR
jgi:hypothetical protein